MSKTTYLDVRVLIEEDGLISNSEENFVKVKCSENGREMKLGQEKEM